MAITKKYPHAPNVKLVVKFVIVIVNVLNVSQDL